MTPLNRRSHMQGLMTFRSLEDAIRAGYVLCGETPTGFLVRTKTEAGWAIAIVDTTL
jgi:hypothetical protein